MRPWPTARTLTLDLVLAARPVPPRKSSSPPPAQPETCLKAPAATSVVTREQVEQQITATPIDLLTGVTGMDVASKGLAQRTYTARGSRGASTGSFLTLVDGRDQTVPSIGFNIPYLVPAGSADVDHIEVVRGPAGAIYGPNTERGVAQIFTRSPFDAQGTTLSLGAGGRDLFQAELRQAGVVGLEVRVQGDRRLPDRHRLGVPRTTGQGRRATPRKTEAWTRVSPPAGRWSTRVAPEVRRPRFKAGVGYAHATSAVDLEPTLGPIQLRATGASATRRRNSPGSRSSAGCRIPGTIAGDPTRYCTATA